MQRYIIKQDPAPLPEMIKYCEGVYCLYTDHLAALAEKEKYISDLKDFGLLPYVKELGEQIASLTESCNYWRRLWRLTEAAERKAGEEIAALKEENEALHIARKEAEKTWIDQEKQIAALTAERDNLIMQRDSIHAQSLEFEAENKRLREMMSVMPESFWEAQAAIKEESHE